MTVDHWIEASENAQRAQLNDIGGMGRVEIESRLSEAIDAYTVLGSEGEVLACLCTHELGEDSVKASVMMVENIGLRLYAITKCLRAWLSSEYRVIYADVRKSFIEGQGWARLLGFKEYDEINDYYKDGETAIMYRRV